MAEAQKVIQKYIDYHCHILPAIDDGAADMAESIKMARILVDVGFTDVCCTPHHIKGAYDNGPEQVRLSVAALQKALDKAAIPLRVRPGTEYYLDEYVFSLLDTPLTLNASGLTLLEAPLLADAGIVIDILSQLTRRGIVALIAHPERCRAFAASFKESGAGVARLFNAWRSAFQASGKQAATTSDVELASGSPLEALRAMGCKFQGNIGSFAGVYGDQVRSQAIRFLEAGVYNCLGSDAHRADHLGGMLLRGIEVIEQMVGKDMAEELLSGRGLEK